MKYYTITVNGNTYEVSVEENTGVAVSQATPLAAPTPVKTSAPKAEVKQPTPAKPAAAPTTSAAGGVKVSSPMPGKILSLKANAGQTVKKGEVILILEAMKMENEIVAPQDGTVASINVTVGQSVEAGDLLATLN
ncbi:biotin/lipoyl-binding protein [Mobilitalea sibirica]|uniref:Biotin/lipoyl-binding protein n=1 Tax=Mobilitalea sibirica TaxID=1462919 RepID=A0A8J7HEI5_9FIRM|nr:biotin/lipoyl-containing protein [Mobilitalea sibirica]MBH1942394.1 biotin/lipoyl-binding protein [Mobilitalea sibirica]